MTTADLPPILTAEEVAKLLRVNPKTLYAAARRGEVPGVVRLGRAVRFRRDAVLSWSSQGRVVPHPKGKR